MLMVCEKNDNLHKQERKIQSLGFCLSVEGTVPLPQPPPSIAAKFEGYLLSDER